MFLTSEWILYIDNAYINKSIIDSKENIELRKLSEISQNEFKSRNTEELFENAIKKVGMVLSKEQFYLDSFLKNTPAYYVSYKKNDCIVKFIFGPPQFEVDMVIYTKKGEFEFKDILQIPPIKRWVENNKYQFLKKEILNQSCCGLLSC